MRVHIYICLSIINAQLDCTFSYWHTVIWAWSIHSLCWELHDGQNPSWGDGRPPWRCGTFQDSAYQLSQGGYEVHPTQVPGWALLPLLPLLWRHWGLLTHLLLCKHCSAFSCCAYMYALYMHAWLWFYFLPSLCFNCHLMLRTKMHWVR